MICCCSICQDAIGNHNNESTCDTAARMIRVMNRSFVGEAIKFITTVALAFLIGYYALKSQVSSTTSNVIIKMTTAQLKLHDTLNTSINRHSNSFH